MINLASLREVLSEEVANASADLAEENYFVEIEGTTFEIKPLSIGDLSLMRKSDMDLVDLEDYYVQKALISPENFSLERAKAGLVTQLVNEILAISGFSGISEIGEELEYKRDISKTDIIHEMKSYILAAMPAYTEEDLDELSMDEFLSKVVLAENIITVHQNMAGLESTGFKLVVTSVDQQPETRVQSQSVQSPPPQQVQKSKSSNLPPEEYEKMKNNLISQIRAQNRESYHPLHSKQVVDETAFEDADIETLQKILGMTPQNDPIAAKLHSF